ncbi:MAG: TetR/AcrR family transcriptional regulator, partial [Tannerellaceae bacterium]|nr:TetR/AcrR family transcriptional regulator [Tannerellaceae bacterium]
MEQKRHRRKKIEVENVIENSVREAIVERGYNRLRISNILEKARIEPGVFYNRYKDLDDCLDKIVRKYDYWLNDSLKILPDITPAENLENIIVNLIDALDANSEMQQLLVWELSEYNKTTVRTSNGREEDIKSMIEIFNDAFKDMDIDYRYFSALFIGGIYYLI